MGARAMFLVLVAVTAGLVVLAHTAPAPFLLEYFWRGIALWHMPRERTPTVYLTFDDGPNPSATPELLNLLAREHVRATFFVVDRHITDETAFLIRRMFEDGHAVGIHSYRRALLLLGPSAFAGWVTTAAARIEMLTGHPPCRVFRPHAGWRTAQMLTGLRRIEYRMVGWGWMLWDWNWYRRPSCDTVVPRILGRVRSGDIVVLHDGHEAHQHADRRHTIETVSRLIPALRARGFSFGIVCEPGGVF
jgi:peptidoglycan/xylan/chitin deacetylase (PgdA/CDA1 family)